jgi:cobalt/nickel transport system permease protein
MNRDRLALLAWLGSVVLVTMIHDALLLACGSAALLLVSGTGRGALLWRALRGVAFVMVVISAGYLLVGLLTAAFDPAVLLLYARVALLALLTAWMVRDVNISRALSGWPTAQRWLAIVQGQLRMFQRLAADYRLARLSRSSLAPTLRQRYLGTAALTLAALDKAVHNADTVTQAMRSRGALDD